MIYPKSQITKRWYRIDQNAGNVLEVYTSKPRDIVTHCVGFDNCPTLVDETVNPKYGTRLPDRVMGYTKTSTGYFMFPFIEVSYYLTTTHEGTTLYANHKKDRENKYLYIDYNGVETAEENFCGSKELPFQPAFENFYVDSDGETNWLEEDEKGIALFKTVLWLDNMVSEGDITRKIENFKNIAAGSCNEAGTNIDVSNVSDDTEQYAFIYSDPDKDTQDGTTYWDIFEKSVIDEIFQQLMEGMSWKEIQEGLPFYITGKGTDPNSGYDIKVHLAWFNCAKTPTGTSGHASLKYIQEPIITRPPKRPDASGENSYYGPGTPQWDINQDVFKEEIKNRVNLKVKECRDNIYDKIDPSFKVEGGIRTSDEDGTYGFTY